MIDQEIQNNIVEYLTSCQFRKFCDSYFADKFKWTIRGTSILSGEYNNKEEFFDKVINRIGSKVLPGWTMKIKATYAIDKVLIIEMLGSANTKTGKHYNNEYCWILKFNENNKIDSLTAYYDSLLVNQTLLDE